jgi:hypothetical protein
MFIHPVCSQELSVPKIWLKVLINDSITRLIDVKNAHTKEVLNSSLVNYNPSIHFGDSSVYALVYTNLHNDSVVTIFTAYHTESDGVVGLWEIDSDSNRKLWLNSQRSSIKNTNVRYRKTTEDGGIVNTVRTEYPDKMFDIEDSTFALPAQSPTNDTLYIGKSKEDYFSGNFIEWLYFAGTINQNEQQKWETYLAIKCGARLKNIYVNSLSDTLWNTNIDSLYSVGICGIGRDDSLTLNQPKSTIWQDNLTVESQSHMSNLSHIIWGHNGMFNEPIAELENLYFIDTIQMHPFAKVWRLNTNSNNALPKMKLTCSFPGYIIPETLRLIMNMEDSVIYNNNSIIYIPTNINDTVITFDSIQLSNNATYYLRIVAIGDSIYQPITTKSSVEENGRANTAHNFIARVTPNPSNTGEFLFEVLQNKATAMQVNITDSQGKIVYTAPQIEQTHYYTLQYTIDKQGVYLINVTTPNNKKSVKLIISK